MRLRILSDVHIRDHGPPDLCRRAADPPADAILMAGDTHRGPEAIRWMRATFPERPVVCVAGNHEHYDGCLDTTLPALRGAADDPSAAARGDANPDGVYFLERDEIVLGDLWILGCTFWTDFTLFEGRRARAMRACRADVDDYRRIHLLRARRALRPRDTARIHQTSIRWLRDRFAEPPSGIRATVVLTHHPPSRRSVDPRYADSLTSAAFVARRGPLVETSGAALWVHGHVHASFDYRLGGTRVLSNPQGHGDENPGFRSDLVVEV
ncbi:metallophosphoesterase [Salinibacter ruber]|uniref:metallophosphoesterase n=1 Tax=Salinibacter ruber TaxID=146919 RepID=UPI002168F8B4|nr:metallophosphoesterase [Salinibacter ruber]MCS3639430.1 3',5'-cyclic AMP phosphodiesterase CpdA [Salinibacter ruber]